MEAGNPVTLTRASGLIINDTEINWIGHTETSPSITVIILEKDMKRHRNFQSHYIADRTFHSNIYHSILS